LRVCVSASGGSSERREHPRRREEVKTPLLERLGFFRRRAEVVERSEDDETGA